MVVGTSPKSFGTAAAGVRRSGQSAKFGLNARHLGTTRAGFVLLRRSGGRFPGDPPASGRSRGSRPRLPGFTTVLNERHVDALTGQVRGRLIEGCDVGIDQQVDADDPRPCPWSVAECSELVGVIVSTTVAGERCDGVAELWRLMVSPWAHRFHCSRASTWRRRSGTSSRVQYGTNPSRSGSKISDLEQVQRLVISFNVRAVEMPRMYWRCPTALSSAASSGGVHQRADHGHAGCR